MDKAALTAKFDDALLTEEEFAQGPEAWRRLRDPFPSCVQSSPEEDEEVTMN